jgi:signal peptidase I
MTEPVMQNSSSTGAHAPSDRSLVLYTIIALGIALVIRFFIAAPFVVSGSSMEPTFNNWDYLIVDRITYDIASPQRGDVVVLDLPQDTSRSLIKRVVGLPGETIHIERNTVTITNPAHPNGFQLTEPYVAEANFGGASNMTVTLGPDEFFVLGDNRRVSADSRVWGTLPRSDIVGRVLLRLFPFVDAGVVPGQARYSEKQVQ